MAYMTQPFQTATRKINNTAIWRQLFDEARSAAWMRWPNQHFMLERDESSQAQLANTHKNGVIIFLDT